MLKLADIETLIWLIVAAVVLIAKGWGKLQGQIDKDSSKSDEAPPVEPVRRSAQTREGERPRPPRPQPRKISGSAPVGARPVLPRTRTASSPTPRGAQPTATPSRSAPTPVGSPPPREAWRVDPDQIRRFMEQLSGQGRPTPPPMVHPPVYKAEAPALPPTPAKTAHAPVASVMEPAMASAPAEPSTSRAALWAEALRDKQNIRNIIISYEIIGPPKAM